MAAVRNWTTILSAVGPVVALAIAGLGAFFDLEGDLRAAEVRATAMERRVAAIEDAQRDHTKETSEILRKMQDDLGTLHIKIERICSTIPRCRERRTR